MLVAVEQERSASVCNSVFACGYATSENKPTFETHCEASENSPFHQCRNVDDCRMHTCGPRGTFFDGVSSHRCGCDIDGEKVCENHDDCGDASENPMPAVSVARPVLNVFVGERGDKLVAHLNALAEARGVSQT